MITGEAKYADLMERTLYNGFLAGLSLDGRATSTPTRCRSARVTWPGGDDRRLRARGALVRLRLLPAERDADPRLTGALRAARR